MPPFVEDTILIVTPEGKIVREWSVGELLRKNDLAGCSTRRSGPHPQKSPAACCT